MENKIRAARIAAGLSQEELAQKIGVTQTHVSRWERGANIPQTKAIKNLAKALGVSVGYLLEDGEEARSEDLWDAFSGLVRGKICRADAEAAGLTVLDVPAEIQAEDRELLGALAVEYYGECYMLLPRSGGGYIAQRPDELRLYGFAPTAAEWLFAQERQ